MPPELAQVVERMMAKDPARRFQTPDEVARALAPFADAQAARAAATRLDDPAISDTPPHPRPSLCSPRGGGSEAIGTGHLLRCTPAVALGANRGRPGHAAHRGGVSGPLRLPHPACGPAGPGQAPQVAQGEPSPAKVISPRTQAILDTLEQTIPINFADETPLDDVLTYIKYATFKEKKPTDPGLPIYVDPVVEQALTFKVRIDVNDAPLRLTLSLLLNQVGLVYLVKDDVLIISSPQGINQERNETASPAVDATPRTKRLLAKLEEPISMSFDNPISLDDVLAYIRQATTTSRGDDGIPIFSDPRAFRKPAVR